MIVLVNRREMSVYLRREVDTKESSLIRRSINKAGVTSLFALKERKYLNGPIYTRDGSSVWDELGQRTVVRLIIRLCINTGFQTDHPSRRTITVVRLDRRTTVIVRLDG